MSTRRLRDRRSLIGVARAHVRGIVPGSGTDQRGAAGRQAAGASTVEFAMALPLLAAVTIALCGAVLLARDAVLAQGAAREGARAAAVSGDRSLAAKAARAALPAGRKAIVTVTRPSVDRVKVEIRLSLPLPYSGSIPVTAEAVAAVEPGEVPDERRGPS